MANQAEAVRSEPRASNAQQVQDTLSQEIVRLEKQLEQVQLASSGARVTIANTYREMIDRRKELLERLKSLPAGSKEGVLSLL